MRPILFGEVLFDVFPDGRAVLGGAPFNVAWHLKGLGLDPLLISRVGEDREGDEILKAMDDFGMDISGIQRDPRHPTGCVKVSVDDGGRPAFAIPPAQAFDFIDPGDFPALPSRGLLYHGTLAVRSPSSERALRALRGRRYPVLVDVNLRAPWWEKTKVEGMLDGAQWVKANGEEMEALGYSPEAMMARFGLALLAVTHGEEGAVLVTPEGSCEGKAIPTRLVDTVGAGDAFSAMLILGLLEGWVPREMLDRALAFSSRVCALRGAVGDKGFYSGSS